MKIEIYWFLEKLAGKIWQKFCPDDRASYWLDFLPAFFYKKRKEAERK
jgi:hypothetical protein